MLGLASELWWVRISSVVFITVQIGIGPRIQMIVFSVTSNSRLRDSETDIMYVCQMEGIRKQCH